MKGLLRNRKRNHTTDEMSHRRINFNKPVTTIDSTYKTNQVRTSKYTLLSFLPKNIFEQFRGIANFYFLSLVALQAFSLFKTVDVAVAALPIVLIVAMTAFKDAFEDYKRHSADSSVNALRTYTLNTHPEYQANRLQKISNAIQNSISSIAKTIALYTSGTPKPQEARDSMANPYPPALSSRDYLDSPLSETSMNWSQTCWKDVKGNISNLVGGFILVRNRERIPADIIIISTSEPESMAYIETKNLDGETNLKIKRGIQCLSHVKTPDDCLQVRGYIDAEPPNNNLFVFSGNMVLYNADSTTKEVPIGANGILLRGCVLRNTKWVIGLVAYTGPETKIMLNSGETPSKRSRVDRQINPQTILNFAILACLCLIAGFGGALYYRGFQFDQSPFIGIYPSDYDEPFIAGVVTFFNCLILFQNLIPIALYISLEITKTAQSFLIHADQEMFDEDTGKSAQPKSWNLCDDLGQIEYIFSDKTGTLTSNMMEFRKASINGHIYGKMFLGSKSGSDKYAEAKQQMMGQLSQMFDTKYVSENPPFIDSHLAQHLKQQESQSVCIREFFTLLAVCHTVLLERPTKSNPDALIYNAQSPDEAALVSAARDVGFAFIGRDQSHVLINVMNEKRAYQILHIMEFNSDRKRMSVVVRRPEGQVILLCKGADSVIFERLSAENDPNLCEKTMTHLSLFANDGFEELT